MRLFQRHYHFSRWVNRRINELEFAVERRADVRGIPSAEEIRRATNSGRLAAIAQYSQLGRSLLPGFGMSCIDAGMVRAYQEGYEQGQEEVDAVLTKLGLGGGAAYAPLIVVGSGKSFDVGPTVS